MKLLALFTLGLGIADLRGMEKPSVAAILKKYGVSHNEQECENVKTIFNDCVTLKRNANLSIVLQNFEANNDSLLQKYRISDVASWQQLKSKYACDQHFGCLDPRELDDLTKKTMNAMALGQYLATREGEPRKQF
jgi:hypothetical protein